MEIGIEVQVFLPESSCFKQRCHLAGDLRTPGEQESKVMARGQKRRIQCKRVFILRLRKPGIGAIDLSTVFSKCAQRIMRFRLVANQYVHYLVRERRLSLASV